MSKVRGCLFVDRPEGFFSAMMGVEHQPSGRFFLLDKVYCESMSKVRSCLSSLL